MARPSLYATIKHTRSIQNLKFLLKSLIKDYIPAVLSSRLRSIAELKAYASETSQRIIESQWDFCRCLTKFAHRLPRHGPTVSQTVSPKSGRGNARFLNELEIHATHGNHSLPFFAAQVQPFLQHDLALVGITNINKFEKLSCVKSALTNRLQDQSGSHAVRKSSGLAEALSGELDWDKFAAYYQPILWRLQRTALEAMIHDYLKIVGPHILRWHFHWQHSKRTGEGWFTEWPNNHRPLSTTWPWNIKPSLLVLWGVCWMFYGSPENDNESPTRNPRGAERLRGNLRTGPLGSPSQPPQQDNIAEAWAGPAASNTYSNYSWLYPTQAGVARRANSDTAILRENTLPTSYATSVPSYPYISSLASSPLDVFPTSTVTWPYCQGINPVSSPAYAPSYPPWQTQPSLDPTGSAASTTRHTDPGNIAQPYAQRTQTANPGIPQVAAGSISSLGFGLGLSMSDMQDYPSPGSSTSGQTNSSYVSVLPPNVLSPGMPLIQSPSVAGSVGSRQSSRRSQEPPRNPEGLLYCTHVEHAQEQPPVFSRRCEWRKHMDKHERPYVCEEPECENIRGFTYSGGLLRHQREVHRQHGGPKASSMCPYPDCKRHVGVGFSRKENLAEHLRRVHRDAGADQTQKEDLESALDPTSGTPRTGRKRRRAVPDDDSDAEENLEQEVKKLKKQLQDKEERLEKLEKQMELLIKGQK